ncbi:MAG: AAA family ATPase [Lachnospiraceae bacterium]|nr:AAA family ATPase [Lachnospiraceae bacterium]
MGNSCAEVEQSFREWLRSQFSEEGMRRYTDNAIIAYSHALRTACTRIEPFIAGNLFYIEDSIEYDITYEKLIHSKDFERVNRESGNGTLLVAMQLYQAYLRYAGQASAPDISAPFYQKTGLSQDIYSEYRGEEFRYEEVAMTPIQRIYYGAPGTGKSYSVNKMLESLYPDKMQRDTHSRRVIFHPTYRYEDFVGSIRPLMTVDRPLDYQFAAGPFTVLLKEAFLNPKEAYYLVIEEINRGNAPAIFGDLFQLLDRQDGGRSEYAITNIDIINYLSRDPGLKNIFAEGKIWLPPNFNIIATMNTADENIFVLDSAFKRRFALEYVRINFDYLPEEWSHPYETFAGRKPLTAIFRGTPLEDYADQLYYEGKLSRDWPTFARLVNRLIDLQNKARRSQENRQLTRIPENKKLGQFFVSEADLCQKETFLNKVVFYLKQDVFMDSEQYMTESYEEIYLTYVEDDADIFELLVP